MAMVETGEILKDNNFKDRIRNYTWTTSKLPTETKLSTRTTAGVGAWIRNDFINKITPVHKISTVNTLLYGFNSFKKQNQTNTK